MNLFITKDLLSFKSILFLKFWEKEIKISFFSQAMEAARLELSQYQPF
jgi:hypothetical protein